MIRAILSLDPRSFLLGCARFLGLMALLGIVMAHLLGLT